MPAHRPGQGQQGPLRPAFAPAAGTATQYWRRDRSQHWLFPGRPLARALSRSTPARIVLCFIIYPSQPARVDLAAFVEDVGRNAGKQAGLRWPVNPILTLIVTRSRVSRPVTATGYVEAPLSAITFSDVIHAGVVGCGPEMMSMVYGFTSMARQLRAAESWFD